MNIKYFMFLINLINISYKHKKTRIKITYNVNLKPYVNFLYKYNYIKNVHQVSTQNILFLTINYYKFNAINSKIFFFKKNKKYILTNYYCKS